MSELLTDADLVAVTGAKQAVAQKRVLEQNGIYYIERKDGTITTTWYHVNHPSRLRQPTSPVVSDGPDMSKVRIG